MMKTAHNLHYWAQRLVTKGQHGAHMAYLGLVAVESHGWYGKAAAVMLLLGIAAHWVGVGEAE